MNIVSGKTLQQAVRVLFAVSVVAFATLTAAYADQSDWPHTKSDLKPDPAVTYGRLPNGMRYAIMKNNSPADAVSMRLVMDAGFMHETDAQRGVAHLLEHMAFRGSKNIADGDVVKRLERIGLRFGADTNASTSLTQTVYRFDLPKSDDESVGIGLNLLREIASELTIANEALVNERQVAMAELRMRNENSAWRTNQNKLSALLPDQPALTRNNGGDPTVLEIADSKLVRSFYDTWYRPERATLLVVGNIDSAKIEKKIAADFSSWKSTAPAANEPDWGTLKKQSLTVKSYSEKDLPTTISINWLQPYRRETDTRVNSENVLLSALGTSIINQRLQQAAVADNAAYTLARLERSTLLHSAKQRTLGIVTTAEKWQAASQAAKRILDEALSQGVTQEEVDRMVRNMQAGLQNMLKASDTRATTGLIEGMVRALDNNDVFQSSRQSAEFAESVIKNLRSEKVNQVLREVYRGEGPVIYATSAAPIANVEEELKKVFSASPATVVAATPAAATSTWPYTNFGTPGKVVSQTRAEDINTTFVRFENGVTLSVKPTTFKQDEIRVSFGIAGGILNLPKDKPTAQFLGAAFTGGGLEAMDYPTLQRVLTGKTYRVQLQPTESNLLLFGDTTSADLDTQLQVLTAYLTAPALRSGAAEQLRQVAVAAWPMLESRPSALLGLHAAYILHNGDSRWSVPTLDEIKSAKLDDLKAWLFPMLKQGAVEVVVVGDVTVERAIAAVAATVGALPARPKPTLLVRDDVKFPAGTATPYVFKHKGAKDQATLMVAWPAPDRRTDMQEGFDARILGHIMQQRLFEIVRSKLGAGYAPRANYDGSFSAKGYGMLTVMSDTKPKDIPVLQEAISQLCADLRNKPISPDELERAIKPQLAQSEKNLQTNLAYTQFLTLPDIDPMPTEFVRTQLALIKAVTAERIQRVAQKYLLDEKSIKLISSPE